MAGSIVAASTIGSRLVFALMLVTHYIQVVVAGKDTGVCTVLVKCLASNPLIANMDLSCTEWGSYRVCRGKPGDKTPPTINVCSVDTKKSDCSSAGDGDSICSGTVGLDMTGGGARLEVLDRPYTNAESWNSCDIAKKEECPTTSPIVLSNVFSSCGPMYSCQSHVFMEEPALTVRIFNGKSIKYDLKVCKVDGGAVFACIATMVVMVFAFRHYLKRLKRQRSQTMHPKWKKIYADMGGYSVVKVQPQLPGFQASAGTKAQPTFVVMDGMNPGSDPVLIEKPKHTGILALISPKKKRIEVEMRDLQIQ